MDRVSLKLDEILTILIHLVSRPKHGLVKLVVEALCQAEPCVPAIRRGLELQAEERGTQSQVVSGAWCLPPVEIHSLEAWQGHHAQQKEPSMMGKRALLRVSDRDGVQLDGAIEGPVKVQRVDGSLEIVGEVAQVVDHLRRRLCRANGLLHMLDRVLQV